MESTSEKLKIVIAEDSPIYRKLVETALRSPGYQLFLAKDGREAMNMISLHQPNIVITDWEMPDLTGIELCQQIRHSSERYIYTILLTSNDRKDQLMRGMASGADDYLTKPFHAGELLARVGVGRRISELYNQLHAKNRFLEELALTDALTELPNRRAIEDWGARELKAAERHGFHFWLIEADLDHFKLVNDTYGHEVGDLVLKTFARQLAANTRASSLCGRLGGEEFVVVLSHIDRDGVLTAADRIRRRLGQECFEVGGNVFSVTVSIGIAGFHGVHAPKFHDLLREADQALYAAKRGGRNQIQVAVSQAVGAIPI